MNVAVATYYGTLPMEKVSSEGTGIDCSEVIRTRSAYVKQQSGVPISEEEMAMVKESQDWLEAWDRGELHGEGMATRFFMKKVSEWRFSLPRQS